MWDVWIAPRTVFTKIYYNISPPTKTCQKIYVKVSKMFDVTNDSRQTTVGGELCVFSLFSLFSSCLYLIIAKTFFFRFNACIYMCAHISFGIREHIYYSWHFPCRSKCTFIVFDHNNIISIQPRTHNIIMYNFSLPQWHLHVLFLKIVYAFEWV